MLTVLGLNMKKIIILLFFLFSPNFYSNDILLKDKTVYKNVAIINCTKDFYFLKTTFGERKIPVELIQNIIQIPYDSTGKSDVILPESSVIKENSMIKGYPISRIILPAGLISIGIGIYFLHESNSGNTGMEGMLNANLSRYIGIAALGLGIILTAFGVYELFFLPSPNGGAELQYRYYSK